MAEQTVKLNLDTREFDRGISRATAALGALVSAATIGKIVQTTARFQDLQSSLSAVYGGAQKGELAFKKIQALSTQTQFSVEDLSTTFIKLGAAGIEPTNELLQTMTDAAAVTTDQLGVLNAMTEVFTRTTQSGVVELQEFDKLADRGLPVYDILKEKLGVTRNELNKFSKEGDNTTKVLQALQEGINERFGGATQARLKNLSTLMSNFNIALTNAAVNIGNAMAPALSGFITQITNAVVNSEGLTTAIGTALGAAINGVAFLFELAANNLNILVAAGTAATVVLGARGLAKALNAAKMAMIGLNTVIKANPIGLLLTAVAALIGYLAFENGLGKTLYQVRGVLDLVGKMFSKVGKFLQDVFIGIIDNVKKGFLAFVDSLISAYNWLADGLPFLDRFQGGAEELTGVMVNMAKEGFEYVEDKAGDVLKSLEDMIPEELKSDLKGIIQEAKLLGHEYDNLAKTSEKVSDPLKVGPLLAGGVVPTGTDKQDKDALAKQAEKLKSQYEALVESLFTEEEALQASKNKQLEILQKYYDAGHIIKKEKDRIEQALEKKHQDALARIRKQQVDEQLQIFQAGEFGKLDLSKMSNDQLVEFTKEAGLSVLSELSKQNRAAFNAMKAYNLAMAVMNTAAGVTRALQLPFPFNLAIAGIIGAAGAVQIAAIASQRYQGRKTGGLVQKGNPYIVGEQGSEMFVPSQTGTIIPNGAMGGNSKPITVNFNINTVDARGIDELLTERKATITNIIRDAANQRGQRSPV